MSVEFIEFGKRVIENLNKKDKEMFLAGLYHLVDGDPGELAFIYFTIYLVIIILGPGKYSLDHKLYH